LDEGNIAAADIYLAANEQDVGIGRKVTGLPSIQSGISLVLDYGTQDAFENE
jgi:hypothetical protein